MKKRILSVLLAAVMLVLLMPLAVSAADPIKYVDCDSASRKLSIKTTTDYELVTSSTTELEAGTVYVVSSNVSTTDLVVNGTEDEPTILILCDGVTLTATGSEDHAGVKVGESNFLIICGQSKGTGTLLATGGEDGAGIGGGQDESCGTLNIYGGTIVATGCRFGAGIGGGDDGKGGTVNVYYGTVTATGDEYGAGIGGGDFEDGGIVNIYGGTVTATGGDYAAGIGGGELGDGGSINIYGGTVTAIGTGGGAGIGGGGEGDGGTVNFYGGVTTAIGSTGSVCIGKGIESTGQGTVNFATGECVVKSGADEASASSVETTAFANDHTSMYANISYKQTHAIINGAPETDKESNYGFVSIDKSEAAEGETVTVTIKPNAGYAVNVFNARYYNNGNKNLDIESTNVENVFTFVMPAFPVNITASFIPHNFTVSKIVGGETVPATVGNAGIFGNSSFLNCDCYWSQNTLVLNADGLIVSGNGGEIDSLHISDSSSVKSVTLKNFTTDNTVIIRNGSDAFTLKLEGDNYIGSISDGFYTASEGIVFDCGKLTITGSGNLTIVDRFDGIIIEDGVTGADLVIDENFTGKLTVKDAGETEEEQSEEPPPPCAISIGTGDFIISGGTIELTSDEKNGITAGSVAINGGTITVKGGLVASSVAPILTSSMKVATASVNFDGTSPVETYSETDIATYKYIKIEPIHTHAGINQNGQAATKDAAGFKEYYKCDCGKYFEDENCESEITDLDTWKTGAGKLDKLPSSGLPTGAVVAIVIICVVAVGGAVFVFVFKKKKS